MTKAHRLQLELPVMVDINDKSSNHLSPTQPRQVGQEAGKPDSGYHKPASLDDQSVYKAMSDSYFNVGANR